MRDKSSPVQKMLFWWGWILIVWAIYRAVFRTNLPIWFDEFVAKPLVFVVPVMLYIKRIEKKSFIARISLFSDNLREDLVLGIITVAAFITVGFFMNVEIASNLFETYTPPTVIYIFLLSLVTAASEEILSRGFVLKRLYEEWKNPYTSIFFASILFFFLRVPFIFTNEKIVGTALLAIMGANILFSFLVSFIYILRRNLILPIFIHTTFMFIVYLYLGTG